LGDKIRLSAEYKKYFNSNYEIKIRSSDFMKLGEITKTIYSGQIISRVEAKEDVGDMVLEEKKVLIPKAISAG